MDKKYEILEHKADLKIRAFGKTKEKLFLNALLGMSENMKPEMKEPPEKTKKEVKIKSVDLASLLVDFLSEVLFLSQTNKEAYFDAKFNKFTDPSTSSGQAELEAEIFGQKVARFNEDIKAVTYHGLEIKKVNGDWEVTILFDI